MSTTYPPPPWKLFGEALHFAFAVEAADARRLVPEPLKIVRVLPGKTLGGIYAARYGAGSVLEYSELIVVPALAAWSGRMGFWISHIYVDDEHSIAGGRAIWGLNKQPARFAWSQGTRKLQLEVEHDGIPLCRLRCRPRFRAPRLPLFVPMLSILDQTFLCTMGTATARPHPAAGEVEIPADSHLATLPFARAREARSPDAPPPDPGSITRPSSSGSPIRRSHLARTSFAAHLEALRLLARTPHVVGRIF